MARTVVVTGGGTGIGRAVALRFAAEGDSVIVTGRRMEPLSETVALATKADVSGSVQAIGCDFEANVLTAVLTTEALAERLADAGSVVSIGSIAADRGAGSYGAAKAALTTSAESS